jgi:hypothetical protein
MHEETQSVNAAVVTPLQYCSCDSTADISRMAKNGLNKMSNHVVRILSFDLLFLSIVIYQSCAKKNSLLFRNIIYKRMVAQRVQEPTVTDTYDGDDRDYPSRKKLGGPQAGCSSGFPHAKN